VVDEIEALLAARGHAVARIERVSEQAGRAAAARGLLRGGLGERDVADAIRAAVAAATERARELGDEFGAA
jgi:hypothetical protein